MAMNVGSSGEEGEVMSEMNTTPLIDVMLSNARNDHYYDSGATAFGRSEHAGLENTAASGQAGSRAHRHQWRRCVLERRPAGHAGCSGIETVGSFRTGGAT